VFVSDRQQLRLIAFPRGQFFCYTLTLTKTIKIGGGFLTQYNTLFTPKKNPAMHRTSIDVCDTIDKRGLLFFEHGRVGGKLTPFGRFATESITLDVNDTDPSDRLGVFAKYTQYPIEPGNPFPITDRTVVVDPSLIAEFDCTHDEIVDKLKTRFPVVFAKFLCNFIRPSSLAELHDLYQIQAGDSDDEPVGRRTVGPIAAGALLEALSPHKHTGRVTAAQDARRAAVERNAADQMAENSLEKARLEARDIAERNVQFDNSVARSIRFGAPGTGSPGDSATTEQGMDVFAQGTAAATVALFNANNARIKEEEIAKQPYKTADGNSYNGDVAVARTNQLTAYKALSPADRAAAVTKVTTVIHHETFTMTEEQLATYTTLVGALACTDLSTVHALMIERLREISQSIDPAMTQRVRDRQRQRTADLANPAYPDGHVPLSHFMTVASNPENIVGHQPKDQNDVGFRSSKLNVPAEFALVHSVRKLTVPKSNSSNSNAKSNQYSCSEDSMSATSDVADEDAFVSCEIAASDDSETETANAAATARVVPEQPVPWRADSARTARIAASLRLTPVPAWEVLFPPPPSYSATMFGGRGGCVASPIAVAPAATAPVAGSAVAPAAPVAVIASAATAPAAAIVATSSVAVATDDDGAAAGAVDVAACVPSSPVGAAQAAVVPQLDAPPQLRERELTSDETADKDALVAELRTHLGITSSADEVYDVPLGAPTPFTADAKSVVTEGSVRRVRWPVSELTYDILVLLVRQPGTKLAAERDLLRVYRRPMSAASTKFELNQWFWAAERLAVVRVLGKRAKGTAGNTIDAIRSRLAAAAAFVYPAAPPARPALAPASAASPAPVVAAALPASGPADGAIVPSARMSKRDAAALAAVTTRGSECTMTVLTSNVYDAAAVGDALSWRSWDVSSCSVVAGRGTCVTVARGGEGITVHPWVRGAAKDSSVAMPAAGHVLLWLERVPAAAVAVPSAAASTAVPAVAASRDGHAAAARRPLGSGSRRVGAVQRPPSPGQAPHVVYVGPSANGPRHPAPRGTPRLPPRGGAPAPAAAPVPPPASPPPPVAARPDPPPGSDVPVDAPPLPACFPAQGHGTALRPVTMMLGNELAGISMRTLSPGSTYETALNKSTRRGHRRMIRTIAQIPVTHPEFAEMPLTHALMAMLEERHANHAASTLERSMGTAYGALKRLSAYTNSGGEIRLGFCPYWQDCMTSVKSRGRGTARVPLAMTQQQFHQLMTTEPSEEIRTLVLLTWASAGRGGDVTTLQTKQTRLSAEGFLWLNYTHGKGQKLMQQSHNINLALSPTYLPTFAAWRAQRLAAAPANPWLFSDPANETARRSLMRRVLVALRRIQPHLEQKSLRHGATQAVSLAGGSTLEIQQFTFHAREATTNMYLQDIAPTRHRTRELALAIQAPVVAEEPAAAGTD
jgi:hypothetical protein